MGQLDQEFKREFAELLKDKTRELQTKLDNGEITEAISVIQALQEARDQSLYHEVGRLTRALHDAIHNFHIDRKTGEEDGQMSDMTDATDRLGYVVKMTENAANKTMDLVEDTMPLANGLTDQATNLQKEWQRLVNRDMSADEFRSFYWQMDEFLKQMTGDTQNIYTNLSDILLAQDFQDLTGQVIQKVTGLVREVEASLVDLIFMASQVESITGIVHQEEEESDDPTQGHGPQIHAEEDENVVSSQDDVDDLLSSLGF